MQAQRIVLYGQRDDNKFVCVLEEWDGKRYVETDIRQSHERSLYAFIDCKREAILHDQWHEKTANTPPNAARKPKERVASGVSGLIKGV